MFEIIEAKIDYRINELVVLEEAVMDDGKYYCVVSIPLGEQVPDKFSKEGIESFIMNSPLKGYSVSGSYEDCMKEFNE